MSRAREPLEMMTHAFVQQFVLGEDVGKLTQFAAVRQLAVDDQMRNFYKSRFLCQFFNRNSAIAQDTAFAIDERNGTLARSCVAVTVIQSDVPRLASETGN